jgi:HK97 family phage major capsid protein
MNYLEKLKKELREKTKRFEELRALQIKESLTDEQNTEKRDLFSAIKDLGEKIDIEIEERKLLDGLNAPINDPPAGSDPNPNKESGITVEDQPIYRSRFPLGEQCRDMILVASGTRGSVDARSRLEQVEKREHEIRAAGVGMVESVGEDGGFLLQGESVIKLMTNGWNNNAILSRTDNLKIGGQFYDQFGIDEDSRVDGSRSGGIRWYNDKELAEATSSKTTLKKTRWEPNRLTGLYFMSNEINNDVPALQGEMNKLFGEELAFRKQEMVFRGTGSGEALGILVAPNLVTVDAESGQTAATILHRNTTKMMARIHLKNFKGLVWLVNQDTMDELLNLTIAIGTAGAISSAFVPNITGTPGIIGTLHGYPVVPIEQASTLGTKGDITLTDLSQYKTVDRGGVESAVSAHVKFLFNQTAVRFVTHFEGQPKQKVPLTPNKGSKTVSSTVVLATRA